VIEIVSATRLSEAEFRKQSPLAWSIRRLAHDNRISAEVAVNNVQGLPVVYNRRIEAPDAGDVLVFVHDDVWIEDYFLADRLIEGLARFDVIGVAGNARRVPGQPAWAFVDGKFTWDDRNHLSGAVAHGQHPFGPVSYFGATPASCELLDGVFLACNRASLLASNLRFDPAFDFHFYDMDFCRGARAAGLSLGTWPICLTHRSGGAFGSPSWTDKYRRYLDKWKAAPASSALSG
jgi:GT2 family glycosyltransferase